MIWNANSTVSTFKFQESDTGVVELQSPSSEFLALQGPAGKGEYRLTTLSRSDIDSGIGSVTDYTSWAVTHDSVLDRYRLTYPSITERGHWIAVPGDREDTDEALGDDIAWQVWWYEPSAANMDDFPTYVMVDLEVILSPDKQDQVSTQEKRFGDEL